ncbi:MULTISPECIES: DUF3068 domain-containing protein [Streptomyces]|uniref:DUF3068 domain-containing protein n=1 Tax=Streptomyces TaxID=1883 RepID=UPI001E33ACDC|nr:MULTISPECIES: DUF3068 domain-containing protein [Streptomyces]UFQ15032.1 DUF3068 domain-containing protein [Streptomyces huasconensis]WCL84638.1 DUF3068 domain-containing protein [Streptomyces sp. JCM 35825]
MRRKASLVLLALAVFCAAMSPLTRWYAFPRLAKIPPGQYQETVLEAKNPTLIDYGTMKAGKVDKVTIVQTLKGNVEASEEIERSADRDVVVWDALSYVQDSDGKMVSKVPERYIFDAHSQEPVHATGESVDGDPVRRQGIEFKWPFLTEKRDYEYFDAQARVTKPIHYKGTRTFRGVHVYYFEQTIPWTKVPFPKTMPVKGITPKSLAKTGTTRWYTTVRKFWVEPTTGAPVYGEEIQRNELRGGTLLGGRDKVTVFAGHVKMREDYIESTVDLVTSQRVLVLLLTSYLPWGFLGLGLLLLALSLWLEARGRRPDGPGPTVTTGPEPEPVTA